MKPIVQSAGRAVEKILNGAVLPVRDVLAQALVEKWCRDSNYAWRDRIFNPAITLLACLWQHLTDGSTRATEDWVASLLGLAAGSKQRDGAAFCAARRRLPVSVFVEAVRLLGAEASAASAWYKGSLRVLLVDGTTLRLPSNKALSDHFGHSRNQKRKSRSPLARLLTLVCAGSGAILELVHGSYRTSELALFAKLLERLPKNALIVGDPLFSAYVVMAQVLHRNSHVLSRLTPRRSARLVRKLGYKDELHCFLRPSHCSQMELLNACPAELTVRILSRSVHRKGYRTFELRLVTTLLDPVAFPADDLIELYLQRWLIETDLRTLKQHYGLAKLCCKTPAAIEKEILSKALAYNAVVMLMAFSAQAVRSLSHLRAREWLIRTSERMVEARTERLPALYDAMLLRISESLLDDRQQLPQPRAIVQRPSTFPILMTSRKAWREKYLSA